VNVVGPWQFYYVYPNTRGPLGNIIGCPRPSNSAELDQPPVWSWISLPQPYQVTGTTGILNRFSGRFCVLSIPYARSGATESFPDQFLAMPSTSGAMYWTDDQYDVNIQLNYV